MAKIRVLVVDDSVVTRRLVSEALASDPSIEVVGTASNGRLALEKLPKLNPDAVTLDVEMPELDGIATLVELRKTHPKLPVIMFSAITERGAAATLEAIARGANDYVTKPTDAENVDDARRRIAADLVPRVLAFAKAQKAATPIALPAVLPPVSQPHAPQAHSAFGSSVAAIPIGKIKPPPLTAVPPTPGVRMRVEVVAIGVSTGGPNALAVLIPSLPANFPVPIVVVQHMPPLFTKLLAQRLAASSAMPVTECQGGEPLEAGHVYIAKGDHHMVVRGPRTAPRLMLQQGPPENSCRPAVDVLFRSVAELYGASSLGLILTGMGQDGLRGCHHIRVAGGQILAQDEQSSVIWGMPGAVVRAGLAERVLPLNRVANELVQRVPQKLELPRLRGVAP